MSAAKPPKVPLGGANGLADIYAHKVVECALAGDRDAASHAMKAITKITKKGGPLPLAYQYFMTEGIRRIVEEDRSSETVFPDRKYIHGRELWYRNYCMAGEVEKLVRDGKRVGKAIEEVASNHDMCEETVKKTRRQYGRDVVNDLERGIYEQIKSVGPIPERMSSNTFSNPSRKKTTRSKASTP